MTTLNAASTLHDHKPDEMTAGDAGGLMSVAEATEFLTRTDPRFALEQKVIRGVEYTVFKNAPDNLRQLLQDARVHYGEQDLLVYEDERWDYPAFTDEVWRMATVLTRHLGIRPGDRVALAMRNYPELPILLLAIVAIGAVAVPLNAWGTEAELDYALADSGSKLAFADGPRQSLLQAPARRLGVQLIGVREADTHGGYRDLLASVPDAVPPDVPIAPDDDFAVLYSSGSTGKPKGVALTHRGAISTLYSWMMGRTGAPLVTGIEPGPDALRPSFLVVTPLFHVTALHAMFLQGLTMGAQLTLMYKWNPADAVRLIKREQVTRFVGVPTQTAELMAEVRRQGEPLPSLVSVGSGGAKRPAAQVAELAETFPEAMISSGWGMTETNSLGIIASGEDYLANPEATGTVTPPVQEIRIVDEQSRPVATGEVGELIVKSPANMRCYLNKPEATAEALRDGWLYTGDLARMNEDGMVFIVDRKKTLIIRGGENIACLEVEGALHQHPDVLEACVFPMPDERLGESVAAAVTLSDDCHLTEAELQQFVGTLLAPYKVPEQIWFWPEPLPRGGTDKINRRALRDRCLAGDLPPT